MRQELCIRGHVSWTAFVSVNVPRALIWKCGRWGWELQLREHLSSGSSATSAKFFDIWDSSLKLRSTKMHSLDAKKQWVFLLLWKYVSVKLRLGEGGDVQEVAAAAALSPERLLSWGWWVWTGGDGREFTGHEGGREEWREGIVQPFLAPLLHYGWKPGGLQYLIWDNIFLESLCDNSVWNY